MRCRASSEMICPTQLILSTVSIIFFVRTFVRVNLGCTNLSVNTISTK